MKRIVFLMCSPTYFTVDYEINPWMHKHDQVNVAKAKQEFLRLKTLYLRLGCKVFSLAPVKNLPDMVFTANGAVVHNKTALISNFRYAQRRAETSVFKHWFRQHGFCVVSLPRSAILEGQGEAFFVNGHIFAGYGFRANRASHMVLARTFGKPVISIKLVDPRWYHLDTCFCPLKDGIVLYYPGAFDAASRSLIKTLTAQAIPVTKKEALDFVCNSVPIGNTLVTGARPSSITISRLKKIGYAVRTVALTEFKKSGGGARCLTLSL